MHDAEIGGHQSAGGGQKIVFRLVLAFHRIAEHVEDSSRIRIGRINGGDALAPGNEGQRDRLAETHIRADPLQKRLTAGCGNDADDLLPVPEPQGPDDFFSDLRPDSQHDGIAAIDDCLIVAGDDHLREIGGKSRRDIGTALGHHDMRHGGRPGEQAPDHCIGDGSRSDKTDFLRK